jgi:hypothetical protein
MLRDVVKERRCEITSDQCDDESCNKEHTCGDLAM